MHENNTLINRTCALYQWDLKAGLVCLVMFTSLLMDDSRCYFDFFTGWWCTARCTPPCSPPSRCSKNKCLWGNLCSLWKVVPGSFAPYRCISNLLFWVVFFSLPLHHLLRHLCSQWNAYVCSLQFIQGKSNVNL